ncbi:outer membrane protein assembly factor BamB family protein [Agromyces sp. M3QZ16-3]|uniref:outer membrane protein assembly factor BamB family protein n=1 Tax=Agromyces sp. M3QZ16-3 TaxID=3447585 RepID=UPI003F69158D
MSTTWRNAVRAGLAGGAIIALLLGGGAALAAPGGNSGGKPGGNAGGSGWAVAGGDRENTRYAASEKKISATNVDGLSARWVFTTEGNVSATPAVDATRVYVPDGDGNLYAVDRATGQQVWSAKISSYTGVPGDTSVATPAVTDTALVFGNQGPFGGGGGEVLAVDKATGELLWSTEVEDHPTAMITQSATVFDGVVYVGTDSIEPYYAGVLPDYPCCSFRGSLVALDLATGALLWKTYMADVGYPGAPVRGSSPAIDAKRKSVYIATGSNSDLPDDVLSCVEAAGEDESAQRACIPAADLFDSIVALDLGTGAIKWVTRTLGFDAWNFACIPGLGDGVNCPEPHGPGHDFAQAPMLFTAKSGRAKGVETLGVGQESGWFWALDPATGAIRWITQAGPDGTFGGLEWGSATDGTRVYTANANSNQIDYLSNTDGVWSALDAVTGQILWQTRPTYGGSTAGPVTTANGVVFGCALDAQGHMYALNAATGEVLWAFASGGSCISGAAISNGTVYWGSGYDYLGLGMPNNKLYAFGLG